MKRCRWIPIVLIALSLVSVAGCQSSGQPPNTTTTTATTTPPASVDYLVKFTRNGSLVGGLTLDDIKALPQTTFTAEGKTEAGPTVLSALQKLNLTIFSKATALGYTKGRLAEAQVTLTYAELTGKYILDLTNQNTVKLASPDVSSASWIIDVYEFQLQ